MAINRASISKELLPGLNAVFGLEYGDVNNEHEPLYDIENSDRAFEEEVLFTGFGTAPTKNEGAAVSYDDATESYTARYTNETIALAFAITEEAMEDNLYDTFAKLRAKGLARAMANTKQVKAAAVLNNAFDSSFTGGDGKELCATDHPLGGGGTFRNEPSTAADLNETSLENALIDISNFVDERNMIVALRGTKLIIPPALQFVADRLLESTLRVGTSDNDVNAIKNMGMLPEGYVVNNFLTDTDAFFIMTDAPNGMKMFQRAPITTKMEGDFETGNVKYKARERYSFGFSDFRGIFGSPGA